MSRRSHRMVEMARQNNESLANYRVNVANQVLNPIISDNGAGNIPLIRQQESSLQNIMNIDDEPFQNDEILEDDEPFDDSDVDPHYQPIPSAETDSSSDGEIHSDIEQMADQLEQNLNQPGTSGENQKSRQRKRNLGQSYYSNGKKKKCRECKPLNNCRKKCSSKISFAEQKLIFDEYWALGNYNLRSAYVSGLINLNEKQSQKINNKSLRNRRFSSKYFLKINGALIEVCLVCFKHTLGETDKFVRTIANKMFTNPGAGSICDLRGKHTANYKCLPESVIEAVKEHINSFPAYESHYSRRDSEQKYLHADLSLAQMYKLYVENREKPVSIWKYTKVFESMKIKFKKPSLDQCNKCETLRLKIQFAEVADKEKLIIERRAHHSAADVAYKEKEKDKNIAKSDPSLRVYTFDMQKCLATPYLNTSISFYKRALWTYNLTIHDGASNQPYNYMWHEAIGNRGGNEVASCLLSHLKALPINTKRIIFYSDSCVGQNKNSFVSSMFMMFVTNAENVEVIEHKFLEVGHTHMECDSVHAIIEKQKKRTAYNIHHPRDWFQFVRSIRSHKQYIVTEMGSENIFDFSEVAKTKFMYRNIDTDGNKFSWNSVKWLKYTKSFGSIEYKNSLDENEPFKTLNVKRRGITQIKLEDVQKCYSGPIKIGVKKKKDLIDLLPLIAPEFHNFYYNLPTEDLPDVHPDLLDDEE